MAADGEWADFRTWATGDFYTYLKEKLDWDDDNADAKTFKGLTLKTVEKKNDDEKVSMTVGGIELNAKNLQEKGVGVEASHDIIHCIERLWKIPKEPKVFNDPIHGHIEIPPLMIPIIDTPEFQRLRNIKQLGGTYMVFPGAAHNRFEHSLGVAYLAGELLRILKEKQPELEISERDILCVQIAGLCHDLGHGPFSHLYDGVFIEMLKEKGHDITWKHEQASDDMLRHLINKNHLQGVLKLNGLQDLGKDLHFIASLIRGQLLENEKDFLYQIVSNDPSGIDVDKWDYFARDSYHLGIGTSFNHKRLLKFIRVCTAEDNKRHICFKEKEAGNLYNMFYTRHLLHSRAYQHPVCNLIEYMIAEALVEADEIFLIQGGQNKSYRLSEAMNDMEAYAKLTDSVLDQILLCDKPGLEKAKKIIQRITCRELYHYIGESPPCPQGAISKDNLVENMVHRRDDICGKDIVVDVVTINYGKKTADPLQNVYFYNKENPNEPFKQKKDKVSLLLPHTFGEQMFRVYSKKEAAVEPLQEAWKAVQPYLEWKSKQRCESCAEVKDTKGWDHIQPEVNTENDGSTYTLSSPAGKFECSESGLRWSCNAPVTFQYCFKDWEVFKDMLAQKKLRPAGPLMDLRVLSGKLQEIHLPHFLCLVDIKYEGSEGDAVQVLHIQDGRVSVERCELTRGHVKISNPSFSLLGSVLSLCSLLPFHRQLQLFQSRTDTNLFHAHLVPNSVLLIQTLHQQEEHIGMRFVMGSSLFQVQAETSVQLQTSCQSVITSGNMRPGPHVITSRQVRTQTQETSFELKLILGIPVWRSTINRDDH